MTSARPGGGGGRSSQPARQGTRDQHHVLRCSTPACQLAQSPRGVRGKVARWTSPVTGPQRRAALVGWQLEGHQTSKGPPPVRQLLGDSLGAGGGFLNQRQLSVLRREWSERGRSARGQRRIQRLQFLIEQVLRPAVECHVMKGQAQHMVGAGQPKQPDPGRDSRLRSIGRAASAARAA